MSRQNKTLIKSLHKDSQSFRSFEYLEVLSQNATGFVVKSSECFSAAHFYRRSVLNEWQKHRQKTVQQVKLSPTWFLHSKKFPNDGQRRPRTSLIYSVENNISLFRKNCLSSVGNLRKTEDDTHFTCTKYNLLCCLWISRELRKIKIYMPTPPC